MNWIDAIILVILVVFVAIGIWKGLVFSLLSMFSSFINFVLAIFLTKPLTILIGKHFKLESALTNAFAKNISSRGAGFDTNLVGMTNEEISSHISNTLSESKFPAKGLFKNMMNVTSEKISGKTSLTMTDILSKSLGSFFTIIICFVIAFLLILLTLWIVSLISKKARQVDGIRVTDRILGAVFGLIKGALFVCFIFAILSFFKEDGLLAKLFTYIHKSAIGDWMYSNVNYLVDKYINFQTFKKLVT